MSGELGSDISYFQSLNAAAYPNPFIFIRATFGTYMVDPKFQNFRAQARAKPIPFRAFYHFLTADVDPVTQFNYFAAQVGDIQPGENVIIDDEDYPSTGGLPSRGSVNSFAQLCKNKWGIWPIHYSVLSVGTVLNCPQTDASYGSVNPGGDFWQYTDGAINYTSMPASAGGIGSCDMNRCNGNLADYFLKATPEIKWVSAGG